jgi:hypothetical protein
MVAAAGLLLAVAAVVWAASSGPGFYRDRARMAVTPATEQAARRLVTKVAALQAAADRGGGWEAVIAEDEINGWLAFDLPRNHARLLPAGLTAPRVALSAGRIQAAARRGLGVWSGIVSLDVELRLRPPGLIECTVVDARLGAIPLPHGPWLHWLGARLAGLGLPTEIRREGGTSLLAIVISAAGPRPMVVDTLVVDDGELLLSGRTGELRGHTVRGRVGGHLAELPVTETRR